MNLNERLQKLREDKVLVIEKLRQAEVKASTRARKRETRAKILLGAVVLSMLGGEREALLSMILPQMVERDHRFVSEYLADDQPPEVPPGPDAQGKN